MNLWFKCYIKYFWKSIMFSNKLKFDIMIFYRMFKCNLSFNCKQRNCKDNLTNIGKTSLMKYWHKILIIFYLTISLKILCELIIGILREINVLEMKRRLQRNTRKIQLIEYQRKLNSEKTAQEACIQYCSISFSLSQKPKYVPHT